MATGRPTGRPTKMHHRVAAPTDTDPNRTLTVAEYVCERVETTGRSAGRCAAGCGVSQTAVDKWLRAGDAAEAKQQAGKLLYPAEQRCLDFVLAVRRAHSRWVDATRELHRQIAAGGLTTVEVTEVIDPTRTTPGSRPGEERPLVTERKVKTKRLLPDGAAIRWELEHLARDEFPRRVEVTGKDGDPLVPAQSEAEVVASMMAELDAYAAGAADGEARAVERSSANGKAGLPST